jgi:hypothetical protein
VANIVSSSGIITAFYRLSIFVGKSTASDNPWLGIPTTILTTVEPGVYFIAATLPSLRSLLGKIFNSIWASISNSIFVSNRTGSEESKSPVIVLSDGVLSGTNQNVRGPYTRFGNVSDVVYPSSDKVNTSMEASSREGEITSNNNKLCNKIVIIKKQWGIASEDLEKGTRQ